MISFTIESPEDWDLLTSLIDKEYSWSIEVTHSLINFVTQLRQRLPSPPSSDEHTEIVDSNGESVYVSHIHDGSVIEVSHSGTVYLTLILKDLDKGVMVCDYPKYAVHIAKQSKVATYVACIVFASIITFVASCIIDDIFKAKA